MTYCTGHGLSIQFTYEATRHDGSKSTKQAPRHGREHDCSTHTILLKGNGINKVIIITGTFGATGQPRIAAISGIQFFTDGWESPFYGSNVGTMSTERSSSHVLGYLTGRHGYLIDQLQLVWIPSQQYSGERCTVDLDEGCSFSYLTLTLVPTTRLTTSTTTQGKMIDFILIHQESDHFCSATDMCAVQCVNPGNGRECIPKQWLCDGDR